MGSRANQLAKWQEIRERGFWRFVLLRGVLTWGLGTALLYCLIMWLVSDQDIRLLLPISLVIFPIVGIFWGAFVWWFAERKFKQPAPASDP